MKITTNGVELEPKEIDQYVPACEPNDKRPPEPRLLRCDYPIFANTSTNGNIHGKRMKLQSKGHDKDVPTNDMNRGIDRIGMSRYHMRTRHVPIGGSNTSIDSPNKSRYPLRSKDRFKGLYPTQQFTSEDRLVIDDSQWMDIKELPLRTADMYQVR